MTTTIITGAGGLLGRNVVNILAHAGHQVFAMVRSEERKPLAGVTYLVEDLARQGWESRLPKESDVVLHLAQSSKFREFPESAGDVFGVNVQATFRLLEYARSSGARQFIFASSGGVYEASDSPKSENQPIAGPRELGFYLGSKAAGEILCQGYAGVFKTVILRPFFMYGPGQKRSMLIPRIFDAVTSGSPVLLQGRSGMTFNPIHVSDAAKACVAAIQLDESLVVNLAGPETLTLRELASLFGTHLGKHAIFEQMSGAPTDLVGDIGLMRQKLWTPEVKIGLSIEELEPERRTWQ